MWLDGFKNTKKPIDYKPYNFQKNPSVQNNIVFIMGESTNTRFLSLYGFEHNNTPYLKSQINTPGFAYTKGISSGIVTHKSIPLFFNIQREPQYHHQLSKEVNLIDLAKQQGYLSLLDMCTSKYPFLNAGIEFFNRIESNESVNRLTSALIKGSTEANEYDLINYLEKITFAEKNFIVINPWAVHGPYEQFHKYIKEIPNFEISDNLQKAYVISMLYFDQWIKDLIIFIRKKLGHDTLIIFASDHGQIINEEGMCGHGTLHPLVADIAIFAFAPDNHPFLLWLNAQKYVSHYDLGIKIAELMGVQITNPNDDGETRYIQDSSENHVEFIPYKIKGNTIQYLPKQEIR